MHRFAFLSTAHVHTPGFLKAIDEKDDCQLVAIWDDMARRGQGFAEQYGADYSGDLEAVIARADVDGFIICAENTRHLSLLQAAIPARKPIFCEKPFTTTAAEARKALDLIKTHGTTVHMGYFHPFSAQMRGVVAHVQSGVLGKLTHARYRNAHHAAYGRWFDAEEVAWFVDPALAGGGAFMDMGTHAVHFIRTALGPVDRVFATIDNKSGIYTDIDDNGTALLQCRNGCLATVEASWVQTGGLSGFEVVGSDATLFNHPQDGYITAAPGQDPQPVAAGEASPTCVDRLVAAVEGDLTAEELAADLRCAADAVAIMEACYESSRIGGWVDVAALDY
jgi:predicted dehydrogenase